ncbi:MHC class II regulatory factor RFX1 isoform X1 [Danio rerio]|uniref:MHC class II regulatory factor RFX1 isoform X1 n=2 Tax=Danio rerio TaxID=7955 RepID=A0A8M9QBM6_DANRE|nr:MHC class II regulatory factor RFX1 isoform X1 [Danio rerio]|eukprot:XP_021333071.1 MHC class II regulatory factor RFX1 isoform X1 [Danio rerio]
MASSGYTAEDLQPSQTQGGSITNATSSSQQKNTSQILSDIQNPQGSASSIIRAQATPPATQKKAVLATPSPGVQYVTGEIQSSASQTGNGSQQYIVVTVTEGSLNSNDSESNSPPAVQTGVPTQVVQQVQTAQQRSVVQATTKSGQLGVSNLHITPEHVFSSQFVEGDADYSNSSIRSSSYQFPDSALYSQTTPSVTYYEASSTTGSQVTSPSSSQPVSVTSGAGLFSEGGAGITVVAGGSSSAAGVVSSGGVGSYVIQGGYMLGGGPGGNQSFSPNTRASPATVQWLMDNYETAEGVSLPRCTLYCHYLLHCQQTKLEPVNAASFGKLIRSVFMGLRTRRLGTRGNSKYHYYGLRIKSNSPLHRLVEDQQHLAMRQQPYSQKQRIKPVQKMEGLTNGMGLGAGHQQGAGLSDISSQVHQYQQFLGDSRRLPEFPELKDDGKSLPDGLLPQYVHVYQLVYREHCEAILDVMVNLQFTLVETLWKSFWRFSEGQTSNSDALDLHEESEKRLPKSVLVLLCKYEPIINWTRECDNLLYQSLVGIFIPDVLRPIPSALTQAIRNFAKSLESWLSNAMIIMPDEMVNIKKLCAGAFAQTLRRYTSLNHLAQAARAVLQNTAQITQMLSDLNRVDFTNVQEQASWVCGCEDGVVQQLERDFKQTLQNQNSLEEWAAWLNEVVSLVLKPYTNSPAFPKAAKLFLLKWSFYSSMVIRDLTLRSAASFGSFHLIRLLYDEYMYYLIEHRVAQAKGETPIAVMAEFANLNRSQRSMDGYKDEEDEEEDEEETDEDQDMSVPVNAVVLEESLEPPVKLARTELYTNNSSTQN